MRTKTNITFLLLLSMVALSCIGSPNKNSTTTDGATQEATPQLATGAEAMDEYLPLLEGKRVALIVNQTSVVGEKQTHLLDTLLGRGINIKKVFAPEHGFRGDADAGEKIKDGKDAKTGVSIVSLYGNNRKPGKEQMEDVDVLVFDIQDVGVRFYTYISTMHYAMEACAEHGKEMIVLDRPNPFDYIDGPVMQTGFQSFVGVDPIPLAHGCTVGELAQMINGEGWLNSNPKACKLTVVQMKNWKHGQPYSLPIKPSPNLPNDQSIALYPSLCLFEATKISVARGTTYPFQALGAPDKRYGEFSFTPVSLPGFDKKPMHQDQVCYGVDLRNSEVPDGFTLSYFLHFYQKSGQGEQFFARARWFDQLLGTDKVRKEIIAGKGEAEIKAGWQAELDAYKAIRAKYVLYQ